MPRSSQSLHFVVTSSCSGDDSMGTVLSVVVGSGDVDSGDVGSGDVGSGDVFGSGSGIGDDIVGGVVGRGDAGCGDVFDSGIGVGFMLFLSGFAAHTNGVSNSI